MSTFDRSAPNSDICLNSFESIVYLTDEQTSVSDMMQSDSRDQTPPSVPVAPVAPVAPIVVLPTSSTPSPGAATSSPSPPTRYRKY